MSYFRQFDSFDPLTGKAEDGHCFPVLNDVLTRARTLLKGRTKEQIIAAAMSADVYIDNYWSSEKTQFIRHAVEQGTSVLQHLPYDQRTEDGVRYLLDNWPPYAEDERRNYPNEDNTSELIALQEGIGIFLFENDPEFEGGKEFEYFAVFAIWKVADANSRYRGRDHDFADVFLSQSQRDAYLNEALIYELVQAIESICWAEHLKSTSELDEQNRKLLVDLYKTRKSLPATEQADEIARKRISETARKASDQRHLENRAMKTDVREWYEKHRGDFPSAAKAATRAHEAKLVAVEQRTLYDWMLSWDREKSGLPHIHGVRGDRTLSDGAV